MVENVERDEESNVDVLEFEPGDKTADDLMELENIAHVLLNYIQDLYSMIVDSALARYIVSDDISYLLDILDNMEENIVRGKKIVKEIAKRMGIQVGQAPKPSNHNC